MTTLVSREKIEALLPLFTPDPNQPYTLSELIAMAEKQGAALSHLVVAQAMAQEKLGYEALLKGVMDSFQHNLSACELGLTTGRSFLLGKVASDVAREMGFSVLVMGDVIRQEAAARGLEPSDENLGKVGNKLLHRWYCIRRLPGKAQFDLLFRVVSF